MEPAEQGQLESVPGWSPEEARGRFRRVLSHWASDLIELRARGLDRPGRRAFAADGPIRRPMPRTSIGADGLTRAA